ncbi:rhamnosyltransferase WsaF family glycosyltransferase [Floccifex sp.]|uniref:rhamnosyltransferase WsaF family glycosyltransferase n=1 Tax=Floccifex sp. TaxID=2815810 RepID=UPI0029FF3F4C|nr:glycosyltransferase [Floccifex sp.]MDD7280466.1 glycosyltransferase [Erysipelotrichaceae bacterium]MDY2957857.1 glycosyltransferase [Floccifex sp.]
MDIKRIMRSLKTRGLRGSIQRVKNGAPKTGTIDFWEFITDQTKTEFNKSEYEAHKNDEKYILNWVIPEMGVGSGGHLNIFRFISYLERHGIHNRVYLYRSARFLNDEYLTEFIRKHFSILDENVELIHDAKLMKFAHGTVATSWDTAYCVRNFNNTISKFYFIQDFEPYFYAHGSEYEFAEQTYKFGFRGITAGDWLKDICINEYGMKADSFSFSYDKDLYYPREKKESTKKVFFYARPVTPRRDFELGLLALNELAKKEKDIEVIFAGWDVSTYEIPFKHQNRGIMKIEDLSELYASCDLCLVISNTNLSLLPLEVMASGSIAVCSKGANSEWLVNEENSVLVDYDPIQIADTMYEYLNNQEKMDSIRKKGIEFAQNTSWDVEGAKVYNAIVKGIKEDEKCINNWG